MSNIKVLLDKDGSLTVLETVPGGDGEEDGTRQWNIQPHQLAAHCRDAEFAAMVKAELSDADHALMCQAAAKAGKPINAEVSEGVSDNAK